MKRVVFVIRNAKPWLFSALLVFCPPLMAEAGDPESLVVQAVAAARKHSSANQTGIIREFMDLLALRNVASNHDDMRRNAEFILQMMRRRGVKSQLLEAPGSPPVVFGELNRGAAHTVLIYAHYDGQPVQRELWASDPWQPVLREGRLEDNAATVNLDSLPDEIPGEWRLYARSAGDDKAPIIGVLSAIDALAAADIPVSVNLKFFLDGEEEAGSPHLEDMIRRHANLLQADFWLFCDGPVHQTRRQLVSFGVRGMTAADVTVYGPSRQLHSGHYGNWAPNPIMMLAHLLVSMRAPDGRILVDGFAEAVPEPSAEALSAIAAAPPVDELLRKDLALGWTEGSGQRLERLIMNPAINVRGIRAGGVGKTARNAIVDRATVSLGFRLVPDLTPEKVQALVDAHIQKQGYTIVREPPDVQTLGQHEKVALVEWREYGYPAVWMDMNDLRAQAMSRILQQARDGELIRTPTMGGSLPLHVIREGLGVPIVMLPIANHDNNQHSPNENLRMQNLWDAIEIYAAVLAGLGAELAR
ncbi:MAG: M20/M25/M40 family metallo-hydrolase [Gammaproteobacteria bacterium]|nr:M20/M25/M40 family metallo-hydrolase [Gammaproteobacteria bacterium]